MSRKGLILVGASAGTLLGSFVSAIWGGDLFSFSAIIISMLGGLIGIWAVFRLTA